jgi:hypothetical protein
MADAAAREAAGWTGVPPGSAVQVDEELAALLTAQPQVFSVTASRADNLQRFTLGFRQGYPGPRPPSASGTGWAGPAAAWPRDFSLSSDSKTALSARRAPAAPGDVDRVTDTASAGRLPGGTPPESPGAWRIGGDMDDNHSRSDSSVGFGLPRPPLTPTFGTVRGWQPHPSVGCADC